MLDSPSKPESTIFEREVVRQLRLAEDWKNFEIITREGDGSLFGWDATNHTTYPMCCKLKDIEAARTVSPEEYARLKRPYPWPWVVNP